VEQLPTVLAATLVGWCLGWVSAWATDWLQLQDELPSAARGPLIRDPIVQIGTALVWAAAPLLLDQEWWHWIAAGLIAVPLLQVTVTDLRHRYVYTWVAIFGAVLGIALGWLVHTDQQWWYGLLGAAGAFITFLAIYGIGRLLYRGDVEPLARGDITIAVMVGAGAGACTLSALVYGVLASGIFALGVLIARRSRHSFLPYGPGLCLGGLITLFRC
jgi:prepilin signal peptidase PulO-like enzyme (type II secretory pathway)